MQPAVFVDRSPGCLRILVIALHHEIAASTQLASLADGRHLTGRWVDDFQLRMRQHFANRGHSQLDWVVDSGQSDGRRRLGQSVPDGHLPAVHLVNDALHDLDRTGRASHDAGAQRGQIKLPECRVLEFADKHRGYTVQGSTALFLDRAERRFGIKIRGGHYHGGATGDAGHVA